MFKTLLDAVFAGCTDTVDKVFCMLLFLFVLEMISGIINTLAVGVRKR